jgi:hypothetical protein
MVLVKQLYLNLPDFVLHSMRYFAYLAFGDHTKNQALYDCVRSFIVNARMHQTYVHGEYLHEEASIFVYV